jgi:hypothetical protein
MTSMPACVTLLILALVASSAAGVQEKKAPWLDAPTLVAWNVRGWDLVGPFQGGWQVVVIRATANYDGMCRPRQYQDFAFVRGAFAGTLAPSPMESGIDGSLGRVTLQNQTRLIAEYHRYTTSDPLCCPSGTTSVMFEIAPDEPVVRPVAASYQGASALK